MSNLSNMKMIFNFRDDETFRRLERQAYYGTLDVSDMFTEKSNDDFKYSKLATQEYFDSKYP